MFNRCLAFCVAVLIAISASAEETPSPICSTKVAPQSPIRQVPLSDSIQPESAAVEGGDSVKQAHEVQLVLVQLQLVEINLTKLRRLGADFAYPGGSTDRGENETAGRAASTTGPAHMLEDESSAAAQFDIVHDNGAFMGFLKHLEQSNLAKVLAEPKIVMISGRPASFHIGGEFPIPAAAGSNSAVEFKKYGTELNFLATAREKGTVRLDVHFRISELDDAHSIVVSGTSVPAVTVRECKTAFHIPYGQTAVLAGLIQRRKESKVAEAGIEEETFDIKTMLTATPEIVPSLARK
jgi:pilus assembly protein CpaC